MAFETHPGRGFLQCARCGCSMDIDESKTPEELTADWNRRAERTCRYERTHRGVAKNWFRACSECGAEFDERVVGRHYRYCPNCGAKVVER